MKLVLGKLSSNKIVATSSHWPWQDTAWSSGSNAMSFTHVCTILCLDRMPADVGIVELEHVPAPLLCVIQGTVRVSEKRINALAVVGIHADAHAGLDVKVAAIDDTFL